jgi:peptidoglycan hydrolase-like protein with peptidoglycan-binding domain
VTTWIVAESLNRLRQQVNALAPNRSKASDGTIADATHASTSDHVPRRIAGASIVSALDLTHDPDSGLDCARLRDALVKSKDSRIKYLIFDRQIISGAGGPRPWVRRPYSGPNPHTAHLHLSVVGDARCRDSSPWMLPGLGAVTPTPVPPLGEYCRLRDRNDRVMKLQHFMTAVFSSYNMYRPTGFYGLATVAGVKEFQKRTGITGSDANGEVVGPRTLRELVKFGFIP